MAKTLTIAGVNSLPYLKTNSVKIREQLQNKSNEMSLQLVYKAGTTVPSEGAEIIYKDGVRFLFAGFITRMSPQEVGKGSVLIYDVECTDYTYIFNNKIARKAYTAQTLKVVVEDLIATYVNSGYALNTTNVQVGPSLSTITFDHISLRACFEKIAKRSGYIWWIDYQKNLYFQDKLTSTAPETIKDSTSNYSDVTITYDTTQVRNSVIVIGSEDGEQSLTSSVETFTGDSATRSWSLIDKPSQVLSITVNGVSKQFSLDANERSTDVFIYSFSGKSFAQTVSQATLTGSDTIVITYYPRIPIIVQRQDSTSIAFFRALEGGDGLHEYTIKETSITSKAEARQRADQELDEFADALATGIVHTRTSLLIGGSYFRPGQILTVNFPSYGLSSDVAFLIQEVGTSIDEDGVNTEYNYTIRFGGKVVSVEKFLESLAGDQGQVNDVSEIKTIFGTNDRVAMVENAAPTKALFTPPFHYTSTTPVGKWNKSEWA